MFPPCEPHDRVSSKHFPFTTSCYGLGNGGGGKSGAKSWAAGVWTTLARSIPYHFSANGVFNRCVRLRSTVTLSFPELANHEGPSSMIQMVSGAAIRRSIKRRGGERVPLLATLSPPQHPRSILRSTDEQDDQNFDGFHFCCDDSDGKTGRVLLARGSAG